MFSAGENRGGPDYGMHSPWEVIMNRIILSRVVIANCVFLLSTGWVSAEDWPGWRGDGRGISPEKNLPLTWSEKEGVQWKTPIPGAGHSSPIVWGSRVFVSTAVAQDPNVQTFRGGVYMGGNNSRPDASEHAYRLICLDAEGGNVLWSKDVARQMPKTRRHIKNTYASETPVTDGKYVFVSFGPVGLYAIDFDGNVVWQRDLGPMPRQRGWGTASSPILFRNTVIVNCDSDGESYIAAFDRTNGEPVWRTERKEGASWGTPFLFESEGRTTIVTNASRRTRGYEAATGRLLWEGPGGSMITVPSPVATQGPVFLSSGHDLLSHRPILAVRPQAAGDITPSAGRSHSQGVAWSHGAGGPYVTSPLALDEYLYVPQDKGSLTCYEARTGQIVYEQQQLGNRTTITASAVAADGKIYVQTEGGECYVVKPGAAFEILAVNKLDEVFCASPAVSAGKLYLRGLRHLYCIGR
jgi:outer membrane protein assembly factor BamB